MQLNNFCYGSLVLHRDGTIAYCSEELGGGRCAGFQLPHFAAPLTCRVSNTSSRCKVCDTRKAWRLYRDPEFGISESSLIESNRLDDYVTGPLDSLRPFPKPEVPSLPINATGADY